MRDELRDRLLTMAQAVVADASSCDGDHGAGVHHVDREILADLEAVVQEISDEAVAEINHIIVEDRVKYGLTIPDGCPTEDEA